MYETLEAFKERMLGASHTQRIDELVTLMSRMVGGGGDFGVYPMAHEVSRVRILMHILFPGNQE